VGKKAKRVAFRFRVANTSTANSGPVKLCAKAPKKKLKVRKGACRTLEDGIAPGATASERFVFKIKPKARGKRTKIRFTAKGPGFENTKAVAKLRVKKK
jgi:hypothetical protein